MRQRRWSRRDFIRETAVVAGGVVLMNKFCTPAIIGRSPNEKLNIAVIGCGGQGAYDLQEMESENIVALCDVDEKNAAEMFLKHRKAPRFKDYRVMLDRMESEIDAVLVATPDHTHAPAALRAMRRGKHVYCEKPLTWSIEEARLLAETTKKQGVVTQMGTQGMAEDGTRAAIELVQTGVLGEIKELHGWSDRPIWPQGIERPSETVDIPPTIDWDLWLGAAADRPYHPIYAPFRWRGWSDFGTGAIGDMAIHNIAMVYVALGLEAVCSVELVSSSERFPETFPNRTVIRFEFPEKQGQPAFGFTWYDGGLLPDAKLLTSRGYHEPIAENGAILVGEHGTLYSIEWTGSDVRLLTDSGETASEPNYTVPRAPQGHYMEWVNACKGNGKAFCDFVDFAGPLTEIMLLGIVMARHGKPGEKLRWNTEKMAIVDAANNPLPEWKDVEPIYRRKYRPGFGLEE